MKLCCAAVLMALLVGCGTASRVIRLDTGKANVLVFTPRFSARQIELEGEEFKTAVAKLAKEVRLPPQPQEAARRLFEVGARSGSYTYEPRSHQVIPLFRSEPLEEVSAADTALSRAYLSWCERTGRPGDCLRLLTESTTVNGDGRFALAMALAKDSVLDEMLDAFKDMADPHAMMSAVLWTWTTYMILLTVPEPVTKGVAAVMTATIICYVGVDTFWGLIMGFKQLMAEAEEATTFNGLRVAGERYGRVMGRNAARAFAMLATAAIGSTAPALAAKVPKLPSVMRAAVQAETQAGIRLSAVGEVDTVAVSAETVTIALSAGAVAMTAHAMSGVASGVAPQGFRAWGSFSGFKRAMGPAGPGKEWHHIVEQTPGNVKQFGAEALHNTENVTSLDKGVHTRLSGIYSSIRYDITQSLTLTVREWLSTQSYEAQREFGLMAIENVMKGFW